MLIVLLILLVTKLGGKELLDNNFETSWYDVVETPQYADKSASGGRPVQNAIIVVPRIGYDITISVNLHLKQITTLNFP